jgi:hypothetical protein
MTAVTVRLTLQTTMAQAKRLERPRPSLFGEMLQQAQVRQALIARVAGVSRPYVNDVFWGRRAPSRKLLRALAEVERLRVARVHVDPVCVRCDEPDDER